MLYDRSMPASVRVPCVRCGRTVTVAAVPPLPTCAQCSGARETWEIRLGNERVILDEAGVRGHLAAGTLTGQEHLQEGVRAIPIAAHPRFRSAFLEGSPNALALVRTPPTTKPPPRRSWRFALLGITALVAALVLLNQAPEAPPPSAPAPVAPPVVAPADPNVLPPRLDALIRAADPVEEPRSVLLARAWTAWSTGQNAEAVTHATRAVARSHDDVQALALLAALHSEGGTEPELALELLSRARARDPSAPAVLRAGAVAALARNDADEARRLTAECLAVANDLGCREVSLRIDERATSLRTVDAENLVYAMDALAKDWPELDGLDARAALVAARAELQGAEARVSAAIAAGHTDDATRSAGLWLAFRNGPTAADRAALADLTSPSEPLLLEAAGDAIGANRPQDALLLLRRLKEPRSNAALLYEAQAALLLARKSGDGGAALEAARRASAADPQNPAVVQVYAEAAMLAGESATALAAWDTLSLIRAPTPDLARAWATRTAQQLAANHPREAVIAGEAAVEIDPSEPSNFLWHAAALAAAQNGPGAVSTLRGAAWAVDGRHARRRPYGGALPVPLPIDRLRGDLPPLLKDDPARATDLTVALAIVDWLSGDLAAATTRLAPVVTAGIDPEALLVHARIEAAQGRRASARAAVTQALALRPKEATLHLLKAELDVADGNVEEAERELAKARGGRLPDASLRLTELALAEKKADAAGLVEARRAAVRAAPDDLVARRAWRQVRRD